MSATVSRMVAKRVLPAGRFEAALVVVVLAFTSAAVLSLAAGARRTVTSFDRFLEWSEPWDYSLGGGPDDQEPRIEQLRDSPAVAAMVRLPSVGGIDVGAPFDVAPVVIDIEGQLARFTNARIRDGRLPADDESDQIVLGTILADQLGVGVGDDVAVELSDGTRTSLSVAAVIVTINDFPSLTSLPFGTAVVPQGFARAHPSAVVVDDETWLVRLTDSTDPLESLRSAMRSAGVADVDVVTETAELRDGMRRILHTQAFALWITAAITAIAGLIVTYQILRRAAIGVAPALATMQQLGARRGELTAGGGFRSALFGLIAATLGCATAIAASPLFPRGVGRLADPDPGVHADVVVLVIGGLAVVLAGAGLGTLAVWSATRRQRRDSIHLVPLPGASPVASGVRFALEPDRWVGALRPGLLGVGVTSAMLIAVATLGSSFNQLLVRPELSGGWWDAFIAAEGDNADELSQESNALVAALRTEPQIEGLARGGWSSDTTIEGIPVPTMHLEPKAGIDPAMRSGQAPVGPNEVALASTTMSQLGVELGDVVELQLPAGDQQTSPPIRLTVVGEVALTSPLFFDLGPGEGALVSHAVLERWSPHDAALSPLLLRFRAGADPAASLATVVEDLGPFESSFFRADRGDVTALRDLSSVPRLLELGVGVLTLATLSHRVITSIRRHRRDYAVMRTLGATKRQVRLGVSAQGSAVAIAGFAIGVPLGLLLAAAGWRLVADELVVVFEVHVPWGSLVAAALFIVGFTLTVAVLVSEAMQRERPAALLHAE